MRRAGVTKHEFVQSDECEGLPRGTRVRVQSNGADGLTMTLLGLDPSVDSEMASLVNG